MKKQTNSDYLDDNAEYASFKNLLQGMGLDIRPIPGDGNCLFRALGDQLDGHSQLHSKHRREVVQYLKEHREDFEPFVEDDIPFDRHVAMLSKDGTFAGNDAIVAFARKHKVNVIIHQYDRPLWQIHGNDKPGARELHISYHNGDHYSSVRKLGDASNEPAKIKLGDASSEPAKIKLGDASNEPAKFKLGDASNEPAKIKLDAFEISPKRQQDSEKGKHRKETLFHTAKMSQRSSQRDLNGGAVCYDPEADDNLTDQELQIIDITGCKNLKLIRETLLNAGYDTTAAANIIFQLTENTTVKLDIPEGGNSIWARNGSGTRIFGNPESKSTKGQGARPKLTKKNQPAHLSNRQRQQLIKKERKKNREERRHNKDGGGDLTDDSDDANGSVLVHNLGMLRI